MSCSHPLLHIYYFFHFSRLLGAAFSILLKHTFGFIITLEVAPEVLKKSHFFLELLGVLSQSVLFANILAITGSTLHVVNVMAVWIENDLGRIIGEHTCRLVGKVVTQSILSGVINRLLYPNLSFAGLDHLPLVCSWLHISLILSFGSSPSVISSCRQSAWSSNVLSASKIWVGSTTNSLTWDHELSDVCLGWRASQS